MRQASLLFASVCSALLSSASAEAQTVGVSAAVNQNARGIRPGAGIRTIVLGDNVVYNERIETDTVGLLQILLADGTAFTVGPNSAISIDRFVYDPAAGTAEVTASLTKGVFRFIGGKTSKTPGGVTLNTPVGTIGIRGAMADMNVGGGTAGSGPVTAHFDLKHGKELTLGTPGGEAERVFEPGYSIIISKNPDGSEKREVRRTPPGLANEIQEQLSGAPGTSGGSSNKPTDRAVVISSIATENSDRPPVENVPVPTARPRQDTVETSREQDIVQDSTTDIARQDVVETAEGTVVSAPATVPIPTPRQIAVLLLTAGSTYVTSGGDVISNPGFVGLVGGSDEENRLATLSQPNGSSRATAATNRGDLVLPVYSDSGFTVRNIALDGTATLGGVPLSGMLYAGAGGFAAYALGLDGDPTRPVYAITGTPVADVSVFSSGDVRTYSFGHDMLQDIPVPFMRADALGTDYSQASISDLYVLEADGSGAAPQSYQSWLMIEGTGVSQKSGVGVNIGELLLDASGSLQISYGRRGSFRAEPLGFSSELAGTVSTAGLYGENKFYGPNGQYFVLAGASYQNDFFSDSNAYQDATERFSTTHVFNLKSEIPEAQFVADRGNGQALASGGGQTITGYAAGLIEIGKSDGSYTQVLANNDAGGDQFFIQFNGADHSLGGEFSVADDAQTNVLHVAFGNGTNGNTVNGRSVYIDDGLFAATNNNNRNRNTLTQDNSGSPLTYRQVQDRNPRTYVISGDANPIPNLIPDGKMCDCEYLEWGWWGTQLSTSNSADANNVRAAVHLGTWVAGDVTTTSQLASVAGLASATFTGRVIGNVSTSTGGGLADYIATGAMSMTYDFGRRSGNMTITGFDQRDFAGAVSGTTGVSTQAEGVTGTLSQTNLDQGAQGNIEGLFVNDGARAAAGLIGQVTLATTQGNTWAAAGIVAGARP